MAEMASFNSASNFACLRAFVFSKPVMELLRDRTLRDLSLSVVLLWGTLPKPSGSLASRFKPGIEAGVADLILASTSTGLRDAFHFCWSLSNTFSRDRVPLAPDTDLFNVEPGFAGAFSLNAEGFLDLGGDVATGPPSFLLSSLLNSGSRAVKLNMSIDGFGGRGGEWLAFSTYKGNTMSMQKSLKASEFVLLGFCDPSPCLASDSAAIIFISSKVVSCQIHNLSACKLRS